MSFDELRAALAGKPLVFHPPLDEGELARFEAEHAVVLPADYRRFLAEIGNGGAGPYFGLVSLQAALPPPPADLSRPFLLTGPTSLRPVEKRSRFEHRRFDEGSDPHDGCLILCEQGCGTFDFLVAASGEVWTSAIDLVLHPLRQSFVTWYREWLDEI